MTYFAEFIFYFVIWILIPTLLVLGIIRIRGSIKANDDAKHKAAAEAGFWAGFCLFLIAMVVQVGTYISAGFPGLSVYQGFNLWIAAGSAILGFLFFHSGRGAVPAALTGAMTLIESFAVMYALFHYIFIRVGNDILLSLILGATLGMLIHFALEPILKKT